MSNSNLNGRLFEYLIAEDIKREFGSSSFFTRNTIKDNERDKQKLNQISNETLSHFQKNIPLISRWLRREFNHTNIKMDRISDNDGKKGDVTDIRLSSCNRELNLSLKNNNVSIKHQRPGPTPIHFGYTKKDQATILFLNKYNNINKKFFNIAKSKNSKLENYDEISDDIKNKFLYTPTCKLVCDFINNNSNKGLEYQNFIIGEIDYKQIVLSKNKIKIKSFDNIPKSKTVSSKIDSRGYILVDFHNNIILSMRLHNASKKISEKGSLKFDTKTHKLNIPTETIEAL